MGYVLPGYVLPGFVKSGFVFPGCVLALGWNTDIKRKGWVSPTSGIVRLRYGHWKERPLICEILSWTSWQNYKPSTGTQAIIWNSWKQWRVTWALRSCNWWFRMGNRTSKSTGTNRSQTTQGKEKQEEKANNYATLEPIFTNFVLFESSLVPVPVSQCKLSF